MPADSTEKPSEGTVVLAGPRTTHPETGKMIPNPCRRRPVLLSEYVGREVDLQHSAPSSRSGVLAPEARAGRPAHKPAGPRVGADGVRPETASGTPPPSGSPEEPTQGEVLTVSEGLVTAGASTSASASPPPPPHHRRPNSSHTSTSTSSSANPPHPPVAAAPSAPPPAPQQPHLSSRTTAARSPPSCCRATWCRRASSRAIRSSTASTRARWSTSAARSTRSSPLPTAWPSGELAEYVLVRSTVQRSAG